MVILYFLKDRRFLWLLLLLIMWIADPCVAELPSQKDAAAQCAWGVELFLAGDVRAALPLLEAGFAGRNGASFAQPDDLGKCSLVLGALRNRRGDNSGALEAFHVALEVFRANGMRYSEGSTLNTIGKVYQEQGRNDEALKYYEQALAIAREVEDRAGKGIIFNNIGAVYWAQGHYDKALKQYEQALIIARETGSRTTEGAILYSIGLVHKAQGRYGEALAHYDQALAIQREVGNRSGEGTTLNIIGEVYREQGHYDEALKWYGQALTIMQEVEDRDGESVTFNNIGLVHGAQGRYEEALRQYKQALSIVRKTGSRTTEGTLLHNIGLVYKAQGRYGEALTQYEQSLVIMREVGNRSGVGTTLNAIGMVYAAQGRYSKARTCFEQALAIARGMGNRAEEGSALNNIGLVCEAQGHNREARTRFEQALAIARELGNRDEEGSALNNIGLVYRTQEHYSRALEHYQQALAIAREIGNRIGEGSTLNNIGLVYLAQERYSNALVYYEQALAIAREIGNRADEGIALHNIGAVYQEQKKYAEAQSYFEASATLLDSLRQEAGSSLARSGFTGKFAGVYRRLTLNTVRLGHFEEAFFTSERGRARTFLDEITSGAVTLSDNVAGDLLQQEQTLFARRRSIDDELARLQAQPEKKAERIADLKTQRVQIQQDYEVTLVRLRAVNEELAALASGEPLRVKEVQQLLPDESTLLAYFMLDDETIAVFLLTHEQFEVFELSVDVATLRKLIDSLYLFANTDVAHPKSLVALHTYLLTPLLERITTPHLIIVPHAILHYVPFAALTDGKIYLVDHFVLTTLPSASTLPFVLEKRRDPATLPPPLVFGNPTTESLNPLRFAEREAKRIGKLYGVSPWTSEQATKERLIEHAEGAGIVHLAAHGKFNTSEPLESFIALASDSGKQQDGRLTVREIYNRLRLTQADLVVLSACQTNVGDISNGDEVIGLTRAFIFAGTPSIISTLWSVDDRATGRLMERFYTHLRARISKAEALRKAQQEVRAEYPNPYYWGAFVLSGDAGRITANGMLKHSSWPGEQSDPVID